MWLLKDSAFFISLLSSKYCIYQQSTRRGGRTMQVCLASSTSGPKSFNSGIHVYRFIYSGEVYGRYADDARLIRASVTAPTSVVGSLSKLPSSVIILINGQLFSLGSRVCTSILTLQFWHRQTIAPLSHVFSSCSHVAKSNKPRSSRKT